MPSGFNLNVLFVSNGGAECALQFLGLKYEGTKVRMSVHNTLSTALVGGQTKMVCSSCWHINIIIFLLCRELKDMVACYFSVDGKKDQLSICQLVNSTESLAR